MHIGEDRLKFYSAQFPLVEVDSSYYALPSERNSFLWVERTPEDFTFDVKAFRLFTAHQTQPSALPRSIGGELPSQVGDKKSLYYRDLPTKLQDRLSQMFESALLPLDRSGKLGLVVFQFPPWFMPSRESYRHIEECQEHLPQYPLAVEFRNRYWLDRDNPEETQSFLRRHGISFIGVDEPQRFNSSVPPVVGITGAYGIVRFHSRNRDIWEKKGLRRPRSASITATRERN